ncbi:hypothetical protein [Marininema mesophilum]|nr:hypothetical protein [Marininema mesophilum]
MAVHKGSLDEESKRKREEKWVLIILVLCAITFAGLVGICGLVFID